ncbi:MAG: glycosyltransferase family 4 protein [Patulibacter sp.]
MSGKPQITLLRGSAANPWDLAPWELLADEFDVQVLVPANNQYDLSALQQIRIVPIETLASRARITGGSTPHIVAGDHYLGLQRALRNSDIVHAAELSYWFTAQAARAKQQLGYKLAATIWETIPFGRALRNARSRRYRAQVLGATDLFLPTTQRAADALLLEGADPARIAVCAPGTNLERFAAARTARPPADGRHTILSIARLVWEKGHQDVLRALALLRRRGIENWRLVIVGVGGEAQRLRGHADNLGVADLVEWRGWVAYDELVDVYAEASCLVLGSLPIRNWEEQFGMVLTEAMAAHVPVVASASGAIPEVVGDDGLLYTPGDWAGLAGLLAGGPLAGPLGARRVPSPERLAHYSTAAAADRLRGHYTSLLR